MADQASRGEEEVTEKPCSPRMDIAQTERAWAKEIKKAVEADADIENLSDFWYAALASNGGARRH